MVALHNFSAEAGVGSALPLDGIDDVVGAVDLLDGKEEQALDEPELHLTLDSYGYR